MQSAPVSFSPSTISNPSTIQGSTYPSANNPQPPASSSPASRRDLLLRRLHHDPIESQHILNGPITGRVVRGAQTLDHAAFLKAGATGDLALLARCLNTTMNPQCADPDGNTILHLAVIHNRPEVIAYLKEYLGDAAFSALSLVKNNQGLQAHTMALNAWKNGLKPQAGAPGTAMMLGKPNFSSDVYQWKTPQGYDVTYNPSGDLIASKINGGNGFARIINRDPLTSATIDNQLIAQQLHHHPKQPPVTHEEVLKSLELGIQRREKHARQPAPSRPQTPVAAAPLKAHSILSIPENKTAPAAKTWRDSMWSWLPRWPF